MEVSAEEQEVKEVATATAGQVRLLCLESLRRWTEQPKFQDPTNEEDVVMTVSQVSGNQATPDRSTSWQRRESCLWRRSGVVPGSSANVMPPELLLRLLSIMVAWV